MPTTLTAMLTRFGGLTKDEMIAKFNHPNCAPSWDERDVGLAKEAIRQLLSGEAPNVKKVKTFEQEVAEMPETLVIEEVEQTEDEILMDELAGPEDVIPHDDLAELNGPGNDESDYLSKYLPKPKAPKFVETNKVNPPDENVPVFNAKRKGGRPKKTV